MRLWLACHFNILICISLIQVPEAYGVALAFSCFIDVVISISSLTSMPDGKSELDGLTEFQFFILFAGLICPQGHTCALRQP